jgi:amino acid adenylation domain-containing protein
MSTFKLSKNQEFQFLRGCDRFLSLLYSFNSEIDINRLKEVCEKIIDAIEMSQYNMVDVSASFPLQTKGNARINVDIVVDPYFAVDHFYQAADRKEIKINPYNDRPLQITLIKSDKVYLKLNASCIFFDNYSVSQIVKRIVDVFINGDKEYVEEVDYFSYSEWYNEILREENSEENFYRNKSRGYTSDYKALFPDLEKQNVNEIHIEDVLICNKEVTTIENLASATLKFISFYVHKKDFAIGIVPFNRNHEILNDSIGLINTPLPFYYSVEKNFSLEEIRSILEDVKDNRDSFNYTLLEKSFDDIQFVFLEEDHSETSSNVGFQFEAFLPSNDRNDLKVLFIISGGQIIVRLLFPSSIGNERHNLICDQLRSFLKTYVDTGEFKLVATEKQIEFYRKNTWSSSSSLTKNAKKNILQLLEESFVKYSGRDCFKSETGALSYDEVNRISNRMSSYLRGVFDVKKGDVVAIVLPRSCDQLIAMLGIIKAGGCFLSIDPAMPDSRKDFLFQDASVKCVIDFNEMERFNPELYSDESFAVDLNSEDSFYCIYTSGSTGLPKGCRITQRNILNYLSWIGEYWQESEMGNVGYFTPLSFDFTITSIFGSFLSGSCLKIVPEDLDLSMALNELVEDVQVGVIKITPAHISLINKETLQNSTPKVFIVGGEALSRQHIEHLRFNTKCKIYNEYGPTEATVGCIVHLVDDDNAPLIGKPIPGVKVIIADSKNYPLPVECLGEILLAGEGVIKEYLKPSEHSARKFTYIEEFDCDFYHTGDLGKLNASGFYEYLGREDDQIKLNGYRIELAEVESTIKNIKHVQDAAVVVYNRNENKQLVAFWVSDFEKIDFVAELKRSLPTYMIPSRFVRLDSFPLNKNGKLDKALLAEMPIEEEKSIIPIDTKAESVIADAIVAVLKIERNKIGKKSNFISLGGESIKAIQVLAKLRKNQFQLSLQDLMGGKTISFLGRNLKSALRKSSQDRVVGNVELSPIQSLFFGSSFIAGSFLEKSFFNQSQLLEIDDSFSVNDLQEIMDMLFEHHDMLRATFNIDQDSEIHQIVKDISEYESGLECIDFKIFSESDCEIELENLCEKIKSQLDLANGPLIKSAVIESSGKKYFFITCHHLLIDLVSWRIILEDIDTLLTQKVNQKKMQLPLKTDSFKLWTNEIKSKMSDLYQSEENFFWNRVLSEKTIDIAIGEKGFLFNNSKSKFVFVSDLLASRISKIVQKQHYLNVQSIVLRSLCDGLASAFGIGNYRIQMEGHGRNVIGDTDLSRTVGWFTSVYPIVVNCEKEFSNIDDFISLGFNLSNLPMDGLSYGILDQAKHLKTESQFSWIEFNYLGDLIENESSYSNFKLSELSHGFEAARQLRHMADFSVLSYHKNKELVIELNYNPESVDSQKMELLALKTQQSIDNFVVEFEKSDKQILLGQSYTTKGISYHSVKRLESELGEVDDILVLSPLQSGIYFHALADENDRAYFWQYSFKIKRDVNVDFYRDAFVLLLKRHQALRTIFRNDIMMKPVQIILKEPKVEFRYHDLSDFSLDVRESKLSEMRESDLKEGFDIFNGPLVRLYLIKLSDTEYYRIWSNHHLLLDGWSTQVVLKEFDQIYFGLRDNNFPEFSEPPSFSKYINWFQHLPITDSQHYWRDYLSGYEYSVSFPRDLINQSKLYLPADYFFKIDSKTTSKLFEFSSSVGVTLNALVQCLWGLILARQNQVNDVVFGSVISGRSSEILDADRMVGMLINTIPSRIKFDSKTLFKSILEESFRSFVDGEPFHYLPLFEIQKQSILGKDLVQNVITYVNYPASDGNVSLNESDWGNFIDNDSIRVFETTQFDINILVYQSDCLEFDIKFNAGAYSYEAIQALSNLWVEFLNRISTNENIEIKSLLALTKDEREKCILGSGIGESKVVPYQSVLELIEASFLKSPDNVCVSDGDVELTYSAFWKESSLFACFLINEFKIKESDYIGIYMPRSVNQLIALLGIIKSGSAYVPIDVSWPKERVLKVVENSGLKVLVDEEIFARYHIWVMNRVDLDLNLTQNISSDSAVYCIYTSGSTGLPKGCLISHKNLLNYLAYASTYWNGNGSVEVAYFSTLSFDFTITSILGCWLNQGKLKVYRDDENIYDVINEIVTNPNTEVIKLAPAHVNLLEDYVLEGATKKTFILGGEALTYNHIKKLKLNRGCKIINEYGPTEVTVGCITHVIEEDETPFIGKPIFNTNVFILNEELEVVPYGAVGEIYIGGTSVGLGYLGMKELSDSKFLTNPFGQGILYKTGDLARWTSGGKLLYLGRNDNQVKINGYRVELDEIINLAESHPEVHNFFVLINKDEQGISKLSAYFTGNIDESSLIDFLSARLPDYMIPSFMQRVDSFELTVNGKIDKDKLPKISSGPINSDSTELTDDEMLLRKVWSEVLMVDTENIFKGSNFIKLGGDSIKAIRLVVRMRDYGFKINLKNILSSLDLSAMARDIRTNLSSLTKEESIKGPFALSPIQKLFLNGHFIKGDLADKNFYNQSRLLRFNRNIDPELVNRALEKLIEHHGSLRLSFNWNNLNEQEFGLVQRNRFFFNEFVTSPEFSGDLVNYIRYHGVSEVKQKISLKDGHLVSSGLYQGNGESYILISIHHLAVDHISWEFVIQDFISLIDNYGKELPKQTHSYKMYSEYLVGLKAHSDADSALEYWNQIDEELEIDLRRGNAVKRFFSHYENRNIVFSEGESQIIRSAVRSSSDIDIQVLSVRSFTEALGFIFGEGKYRYHIEGHGRDLDDSIDVSRTVGWFTSITPLIAEKKTNADQVQEMFELKNEFVRRKKYLNFYGPLIHSEDTKMTWSSKSWIEFNFLGSSHNGANESEIIEDTGDESSLSLSNLADIIFVGEWRNNILHFRITYENHLLTENEISIIIRTFKEEFQKQSRIALEAVNLSRLERPFSFKSIDNQSKKTIQERYSEVDNVSKLTPLQLGMYFLHASVADAKAYHWQYGAELRGGVDIKMYKESFGELVNRHGILKTIVIDDILEEPLQIQLKTVKPDFRFVDVSFNDEDYNETFISKLIQEDLDEGFVLSEKPPIRLTLVKLSEDRFYRLWSNHHIILDGWSTQIVLDELEKIYAGKYFGIPFHKEVTTDFSDYLSWLDNLNLGHTRTYWSNYLKGINGIAEIARDKSVSDLFIHRDYQFNLSEDVVSGLKEILAQNQITINVAVHFFWAIILSKRSNRNDVVFGSVVSGRPEEIIGIQETVGMFINAVPVRVNFNETDTLLEQLKDFQNSFYEGLPHHYVNLGDIMSKTELGSALINNILTFEREVDDSIMGDNDQRKIYEIGNEYVFESTNYDLNFIIKPQNGLSFVIKYNCESYSEELIKELSNDWRRVIETIVDNSGVFKKDIDLLFNSSGNLEMNTSTPHLFFQNVFDKNVSIGLTSDLSIIGELKILFAQVLDCNADEISSERGFFEMGGHSINAIKVLSRLRKVYGLKVNYSSFAKSNRIIDLVRMLGEINDSNDLPDLLKIEKNVSYDVSPSQRRMWLLNQLERTGNAYNVFWGYRIRGQFQRELFEKAICKLIERHEILRTVYAEDDNGILKQIVRDSNDSIFEISFIEQFQSEDEKKLYINDAINKSFDLKTGPVIRNYILYCGDFVEWYIVLHHIVTDDRTYAVITKEITLFYNDFLLGNDCNCVIPEIQYKDYAAWINKLNAEGFFNKEINYWKNKLQGRNTALNIPTEYARPRNYLNTGKSSVLSLNYEAVDRLRVIAKEKNMTLFSVLLAFLKVVLRAYSNQDTIAIGTPITGRILPNLEDQIGYYLNAVPVVTDIDGEDFIDEFFSKVSKNVSEAYSHGNIAFDDLINELNVQRDMSRNPIFDVWADYHYISKSQNREVSFHNCLVQEIHEDFSERPTKFDLTFVFIDDGENIDLHFEYNTSVYSDEMASNIASSYCHVLTEYDSSNLMRIDDVNCATMAQMELINRLFKAQDCFDSPGTLVQLFHEVVNENRYKIAVTTKKSQLVYGELDELSNAFAAFLKTNYKVCHGQWIAVSLPRNEMVLVAILGIIKLGAAYVPLEQDIIDERKEFILNDIQAKLLVDEEIIEEFMLMRNLFSSDCINTKISGGDFVYCMYTSGSTGIPKSVKISHDNLYSSNIARQLYYGNKGLRSFALYSYSFDSSVNLFFDTLLTGGNLYLYDTPKLDLQQVWDEMNRNKSEILTVPPSLYDLLMDHGSSAHLKKVIVAGEECLSTVVRKHFKVNPEVELFNEYGPTECTVWSLVKKVTRADGNKRRVPIGLPIPFASVLILDKNKRVTPPGAFGELFISGPGVAADYKGNFVFNEKVSLELKEYYKTGDLVRLNSESQIEYISRIDNQLKIRGYRVEAGEIENAFKGVQGVLSVYVTHIKDSDNQTVIVAYYTGLIAVSDLKIELMQRLQDYMIPTFIKKLDTIPLTLNGKVDESSLPKNFSDLIERGSYVIPENSLAYELCKIWSEAMGVDSSLIYYDSDFFSLGGNSLKAIKLTHLISRKFGIQIHLNTLFTQSQFKDFLQALELLRKSNSETNGDFYLEI